MRYVCRLILRGRNWEDILAAPLFYRKNKVNPIYHSPKPLLIIPNHPTASLPLCKKAG